MSKFKTEGEVDFDNWLLDLEKRFLDFQIQPNNYSTQKEYWMHRNCVLYDYEIFRLRKFNNPCRSCGIPLHLTKNFEIFGIGPVCWLCYEINNADKHK